jgi:hypothetical protein
MRLVHSTTLCLSEFSEGDIPPYAILSHRWEKNEVSFQDMGDRDADKAGYKKIKNFCRVAAEDGFEYVWVDTCCIDKTNSSELSEAINSMYSWYKNSEVCYAYLSEVGSGEDPHAPQSSFSKSKWFTRGWTLQELIAPSIVVFYGNDWREIGTKSDLQDVINDVTGIHVSAFLGDQDNLRNFSIAQRMSWAANRKTTRTEDLAYCLLGLFDINMPMLYGEREGAFMRLQEEIIKTSDDPTIFAWRSDIVWDFRAGLLARSPSRFKKSGSIVRSDGHNTITFALTNKGLHIQLPLFEFDKEEHEFLGLLNCHDEEREYSLGIFLKGEDETNEYAHRFNCGVLGTINNSEARTVGTKAMYIKQWPPLDFEKFSRRCVQYRIRAANIQEHYPPGFVQWDGMIKQGAKKEKMTGAIKVAVDGGTQIILLMIADGELSASIATDLESMSLEEIVHSCEPKEGVWLTKPGRIIREISPGHHWFISLRKQIISGKRTLTLNVSK